MEAAGKPDRAAQTHMHHNRPAGLGKACDVEESNTGCKHCSQAARRESRRAQNQTLLWRAATQTTAGGTTPPASHKQTTGQAGLFKCGTEQPWCTTAVPMEAQR